MSHLCSTVVRCWGTRPTLRLSGYLWVAAMFRCAGGPGGEPDWSISGATFRGHPDDSHVVAGCTGRSTICIDCWLGLRGCRGTGISFFGSDLGMAVLAMIAAFIVISLIHAYHPPAVALASIPVLLHPGHWSLVSSVGRAPFHRRSGRICGGNE